MNILTKIGHSIRNSLRWQTHVRVCTRGYAYFPRMLLSFVQHLQQRNAMVDYSTSISCESVYTISRSCVAVIFITLYLQSCIWPDGIWQRTRQRPSVKFCANLGKSVSKTLAMIRQALGEESLSCTRTVQTHRDQRRWEEWRAKTRACSSFFLDIKAIDHKEFVLTGQTVNST
jgi:hypothetical protein